MKASDKIYVIPDFVEGLSLERKHFDDEICYIRKNALLEWLQEARAIPHDGALIRDRAFQEIINHINEM